MNYSKLPNATTIYYKLITTDANVLSIVYLKFYATFYLYLVYPSLFYIANLSIYNANDLPTYNKKNSR
jgi:hypothetical protein